MLNWFIRSSTTSAPLFMRTGLLLCIVAVLGFLELSPASAAEGKVDIALSNYPFGARLPNRSWMPILTRVSNDKDKGEQVGVVLDVPVSGSQNNRVRFVREITVPPHSERTVENYVFLDSPPAALKRGLQENTRKIKFESGRTIEQSIYVGTPLSIRTWAIDPDTGHKFGTTSLMGAPLHPASLFACVVQGPVDVHYETGLTYDLEGVPFVLGEHKDDLSAWGGKAWPANVPMVNRNIAGKKTLGRSVTKGITQSWQLPRKWAAYQGIDTLVLGSLNSQRVPGDLSPQQRHSLLRWVRSGGRLVVTPAYAVENYQHPFWQKLLPVTVEGKRLLGKDTVRYLEEHFGGNFRYDAGLPPLMAEAFLNGQGEAVASQGPGKVLLAKRRVGSGEVWFSALAGESMEHWAQGPDLWKRILKPAPDAVPGLNTAMHRNASNLMARFVGTSAPSRVWMVALLAGYLGAAVAVLLVFRLAGRAELGWPALVIVSVLGLAGALTVGRAARSDAKILQGEVSVTRLSTDEPAGSANGYTAFYPNQSIKKNLFWRNPDTLATGFLPRGARRTAQMMQTLSVYQNNRFSFPELRLSPGRLTMARTMTMVKYGNGVSLKMGIGPQGIYGHVINNTGKKLTDCIVRLNRRILVIGDLNRGEERDLSACPLRNDLSFGPAAPGQGDTRKLKKQLLVQLLRIPSYKMGVDEGAAYRWPIAFYGWAQGVRARVRLGGGNAAFSPKERGLQLLVLPVSKLELGKKVNVPGGMCDLVLGRGRSEQIFGPPPDISQYQKAYLPRPMKITAQGDKRKRKAPPAPTQRPGTGGGQEEALSDTLPGWNSGNGNMRARISFRIPAFLKELRIDSLQLVSRMELENMEARISVRNPEKDHEYFDVAQLEPQDGGTLQSFNLPVNRDRVDIRLWLLRQSGGKRRKMTPSWKIDRLDLRIRAHTVEK